MPTQPYLLKSGERVPGTTTIIGRFKESGALIHWAWKLGMEGRNYREVRDSAADAGTLAHAMIEDQGKGLLVGFDDDGNVYSGTEAELLEKGLTLVEL